MTALIDHRLLVVVGKGGVGRTTVSAALAIAAARLGKRALVLELDQATGLPPKFDLAPGASDAPRRGMPGVDVWSLTVPQCLEDFARRKLKLPGFARNLVRNRFVDTFVDAVPGLHDLMLLGKIENMIREPLPSDPHYDVVILDAPATGHGLTLLQAARTLSDITRAGPFHDLARIIDEFLSDRTLTATVLVTLPEELPVQEAVELAGALDAEGFRPAAVVANQVEGRSIPDPPGADEVLAALAGVEHGAALERLVRGEVARGQRHEQALVDLQARLGPLGGATLLEAPRVEADTVRRVGMALAEGLT
ncbi:MAG: ArsA-related P-loop ATPase [Myxococcota bacterium]